MNSFLWIQTNGVVIMSSPGNIATNGQTAHSLMSHINQSTVDILQYYNAKIMGKNTKNNEALNIVGVVENLEKKPRDIEKHPSPSSVSNPCVPDPVLKHV